MRDIRFILRPLKDRLFFIGVCVLSFLLFLPLFFILFYIVKNGLSALSWEFLTQLPKPVGSEGGGVANAIWGSAILLGIASVLSLPIGMLCGIFLYEYPSHPIASLTRNCVEVLQSLPSIVIGIVAYIWIVTPLGKFSAFSGGAALAILMLPVIVRSTEETLKLIPVSLKEASLALGVPYYRTILKVVIPSGLSGVMTGILLSIGRVAGETAPLLFTAFGNPFFSFHVLKPVNALPLVIFNYAMSPYEEWQRLAWGAALLLVIIVVSLSVITKIITSRYHAL